MIAPSKAGLSSDEKKFVGQWQHEEKEGLMAQYVFRANGSYTGELRREGELVRKFEGLWRIDEGMIIYTYTSDSLAQVPIGTTEKDRIVGVSEDSYTIEAGDHLQRTYFRVK